MSHRAPEARTSPAGPDPLGTVTHARIRAEQGDLAGARRILEARLQADPADEAALVLLRSLAGSPGAPRAPQPPGALHGRIVRLEAYLERLRRNARRRHV